MTDPLNHSRNDTALPPKLADDLLKLYGDTPSLNPAVDVAIRGLARSHFQKQVARRRMLRLVLGWGSGIAAVAAVLTFAIRLGPWSHPHGSPTNVSLKSTTEPEDLNGDGKVDILDALFLASRLKHGGVLDPKWDFNGDGVVDQHDVDFIAAKAVSLKRKALQ